MSRGAGVRKADIERAVKTLEDHGLTVAAIEVRAGGVVRIIPGPRLTGAPTPDQAASLDDWRALRAARQTQGAQ